MNKTLSLALNVTLVIAVAVLYYLHFSCSGNCRPSEATAANDSAAAAKPVVLAPKDIKASKTVYVNIDVLDEKYELIRELSATAQAEQRAMQSKYQEKAQKLQQDYAEFQQKAQQGLLSENQVNEGQQQFAKRKDELDQIELKSQEAMENIQKRNDEANTNLRNYISEYNKKAGYNFVFAYSNAAGSQLLLADDSLDITNDILDGLNKQYEAAKGNRKK